MQCALFARRRLSSRQLGLPTCWETVSKEMLSRLERHFYNYSIWLCDDFSPFRPPFQPLLSPLAKVAPPLAGRLICAREWGKATRANKLIASHQLALVDISPRGPIESPPSLPPQPLATASSPKPRDSRQQTATKSRVSFYGATIRVTLSSTTRCSPAQEAKEGRLKKR